MDANVSDDLQRELARTDRLDLTRSSTSSTVPALTGQWALKTVFFLIFSTIKFMFEGSDLSPNFFNRVYACRHYFTSRRIIFWKSNAASEKDLIFCDRGDNAVTFGKCEQNLLIGKLRVAHRRPS